MCEEMVCRIVNADKNRERFEDHAGGQRIGGQLEQICLADSTAVN